MTMRSGPRPATQGFKAYWDHVATEWDGIRHSAGWREHSDAIDVATCQRWWPSTHVGRALKTDLFDEIAGRGLVPGLRPRVTTMVAVDLSFHAGRSAAQCTDTPVANADVRSLRTGYYVALAADKEGT